MSNDTKQFLQDHFNDRIGYNGDVKLVLDQVCEEYTIGTLVDYSVNPFGYQDFNVGITTTKGNFFIKIFAKSHNEKNCLGYVELMRTMIHQGVSYPKLYKSKQGYLHILHIDGITLRLCVQEYINGSNFVTLNTDPDFNEIVEISRQAALINGVRYRPTYCERDTWATRNFLEQYPVKRKALDTEEKKLVTPLLNDFKRIKFDALPHCLVHGDIIRTNVMKDKENKIWVIDFGVTAYQPRIIELAVLLHDICNDLGSPRIARKKRELALNEYSKSIQLTQLEMEVLPTFTKVTHAMYLMSSAYMERVLKVSSEENTLWLTRSKQYLIHSIDWN